MNEYKECLEIKQICEKYGYGNVMEWASALWRYSATKENFPVSACFVPICPDFIKKRFQCPQQHELYDNLVKYILEGKNND